MLLTGAGSPTGMQVYEGDLLPSIFHGQPIHCDAGPNVVRAYITQPDGAGYKAEIVNILDGAAKDRWFRPSDVCVAPDGSLIVADWYDPGVGGHGMGDVTRGRLFRVTTKAAEKYESSKVDVSSVDGAIAALKSPNESARYLAWTALKNLGAKAEPALTTLFEDKKAEPQHRARALWLLANKERRLPAVGAEVTAGSRHSLDVALNDSDENIRITAIRAARQLYRKQPDKLREVIAKAVADKSPAVRREAAIALRFDGFSDASHFDQVLGNAPRKLQFEGPTAAEDIWTALAQKMPLEDRWTLEALGIGMDLFASQRYSAWRYSMPLNSPDWPREAAIAWRSRLTGPVGAFLIPKEPNKSSGYKLQPTQIVKLLRALQLMQHRDPAGVTEAAAQVFLKAEPETALAATALLDRNAIASNPEAKTRLDELLKPVIGKADFVALVERLNLTGFEKELLDFISANPNAPESVNAARLIAANRDGALRFLKEADAKSAKALIAALGRVSDRAAVAVMNQHFWPEKREDVRRVLIDALALSGEGGRAILKWQSEGKLPPELKDQAALALSRSTDAGVRDRAAKELPLPAAQGLADFPKLPELMKLKGDAAKGQAMFTQAGCVACHRVKGQFIDFGPDLTQIGAKLSKDGLFTAILYPSAAIEHSFIGQQITSKEGQTILGYVISETDGEIALRIAGGASQVIKKTSIAKKEEMKQSLMPPGLAATIGAQGLADLVAWLQQLK